MHSSFHLFLGRLIHPKGHTITQSSPHSRRNTQTIAWYKMRSIIITALLSLLFISLLVRPTLARIHASVATVAVDENRKSSSNNNSNNNSSSNISSNNNAPEHDNDREKEDYLHLPSTTIADVEDGNRYNDQECFCLLVSICPALWQCKVRVSVLISISISMLPAQGTSTPTINNTLYTMHQWKNQSYLIVRLTFLFCFVVAVIVGYLWQLLRL